MKKLIILFGMGLNTGLGFTAFGLGGWGALLYCCDILCRPEFKQTRSMGGYLPKEYLMYIMARPMLAVMRAVFLHPMTALSQVIEIYSKQNTTT